MSRGWMHSADVSIQSVLYLAARDVTTGTVSWTALRRRLRRLALCSAATYTCSLIICRNHTTNTATDTQVLVKDNTVAKNYTKVKVEHTHTHNRLTALCQGLPGWAGTRRNILNIHPLTPTLIIRHPLSTSSIYYDL